MREEVSEEGSTGLRYSEFLNCRVDLETYLYVKNEARKKKEKDRGACERHNNFMGKGAKEGERYMIVKVREELRKKHGKPKAISRAEKIERYIERNFKPKDSFIYTDKKPYE